ncbi:TetR family transcriptional regulator [Brachybacterium endophyticum]|uniref:TetR family transcriptional regulator n=1 Tax=Brachybacterium endophyticum TaxID=2182385 RepID=A0A2U2RJQ4_9MICO|nr:TetR family transcriptional regulator [Brachybacterium endophyticum]PWH06014.1 TetR family transcriptional regulator [Brachybacterium endophyticum]
MSSSDPRSRAPGTRTRRHDPDRRDRIIDACLEVIAEHGLAGTSHRRVAAAADVPLGSMTYHFAGMDELLREAFTRFADSVAQKAERRMAGADHRDGALAEFGRNIDEDVFGTQRELILTLELYTLAARRPEFRDITTAWMARTRATLEPFVDERTAQLLDAMNEGLTIHRALHADPSAEGLAADALTRIARGSGGVGAPGE